MSQRASASQRSSTCSSRLDRIDGAVNRALGYTTIAIVMFSIGCSPDRSLHGYDLGAAYEDLAPGLICQRGISTLSGRYERWGGRLDYPSDSTAAGLRYCVPVPKADSTLWPHDNDTLVMVFDDDRLVEIKGIALFEAGTRPWDILEIPPPNTWRRMLRHLTDAFGGPPDSIIRSSCYNLSTDESQCLVNFRLYWAPSGQQRVRAPTYREAVVWLRVSPPGADVVNVVLWSFETAVRCPPHACTRRRESRESAAMLRESLRILRALRKYYWSDSARAERDSLRKSGIDSMRVEGDSLPLR